MILSFFAIINSMTPETTTTNKISIFKGTKIRKTIHNDEWWFSVVDIIEALIDSERPSVYWTAMKARVKGEDGFELSTICRQLKLEAPDGKMRETDCASIKG
jgi:DNA-damage-inducible protein D